MLPSPGLDGGVYPVPERAEQPHQFVRQELSLSEVPKGVLEQEVVRLLAVAGPQLPHHRPAPGGLQDPGPVQDGLDQDQAQHQAGLDQPHPHRQVGPQSLSEEDDIGQVEDVEDVDDGLGDLLHGGEGLAVVPVGSCWVLAGQTQVDEETPGGEAGLREQLRHGEMRGAEVVKCDQCTVRHSCQPSLGERTMRPTNAELRTGTWIETW